MHQAHAAAALSEYIAAAVADPDRPRSKYPGSGRKHRRSSQFAGVKLGARRHFMSAVLYFTRILSRVVAKKPRLRLPAEES